MENLVIRKGDLVELNDKTIGLIVKYPCNAEISIEIEGDYSPSDRWKVGKRDILNRVVSKEDISKIVKEYNPEPVKPRKYTEKEQKRIDERVTKVKLYLELLNTEMGKQQKTHNGMIFPSKGVRISPKAIMDQIDKVDNLRQLKEKLQDDIAPWIRRYESDLVSKVVKMIDAETVTF